MICTSIVTILVTVSIASSVDAALPCDSPWRSTFPSLFTHCVDCEGTYSDWVEWYWINAAPRAVGEDECESKLMGQRTRSRYTIQAGCDSVESEMQDRCVPTDVDRLIHDLDLGDIDVSEDPDLDPPGGKPVDPALPTFPAPPAPPGPPGLPGPPGQPGPPAPCREKGLSASIPPDGDPGSGDSSCTPVPPRGSRQHREIVPPTGHPLERIILNAAQTCIINDDTTCSRYRQRSIERRGFAHTPSLAFQLKPEFGEIIPKEDPAYPAAADKPYQVRSRRSHRGCDTGARYVLFVLDTSGSIGSTDFARMKSAVSSLTGLFCGEPRIAVVTFGDALHIDFCFNCFSGDKTLISDAIKYIQYRHGPSTRTGSAARCVCNEVLTKRCGLPRDAACIDVIFITDGRSNAGPQICNVVQCIHDHVDTNRQKRVVTHAIGIGNFVDANELQCIADDNHLTHIHPYYENNVHTYHSFEVFEETIEKIRQKILEELIFDPEGGLCVNAI